MISISRRACLSLNCQRFAGHNKWSNIKNIKAAEDLKKSRNITKHLNLIKNAIRQGKSNSVTQNKQLAKAVDAALHENVTRQNIDKVINQFNAENMRTIYYMARLPGAIQCLVEGDVTHPYQFECEIKSCVKKCLGSAECLGEDKALISSFEPVSFLNVALSGAEMSKDNDQIWEMAMNISADDFEIKNSAGGNSYVMFKGSHENFDKMKDSFDAFYDSNTVLNSGKYFEPTDIIKSTDDHLKLIEAFFAKLKRSASLNLNVYTNLDKQIEFIFD